MNKKIYYIAIFAILLSAILIRIYNWPNSINDINCDESMTAINANAIAQKGTDIYGTTYPIYFESWLYGGQSSFAIYIIAFFIKLFRFSTFVIRLPILLISILGIVFTVLLTDKIFNNKAINIIIGILLAINPWHILQSQWVLDCNFFPHIFVIAVYCLLVGIDENKNICLYISMLLFALTMYTYGVALYLIPIFLIIMAIYVLLRKKVTVKKLFLCILIFLIIAIPIILMSVINLFDLPTMHIGKITIQNFEYVTRSKDMFIFSENKIQTLSKNIISLSKILFFQDDKLIWNAFPGFGTIYLISLPIVIFGIVSICVEYKKDKMDVGISKTGIIILWVWQIIGFSCGILINEININRINIIWYILVIWNCIGIYQIIKTIKYKKVFSALIFILYIINFILFINYYYKIGENEIASSYTWSKGLVNAIEYIDNREKNNKIILSYNVCNTDKKDVFIRYATKGNQKEKNIDRKEFLKYYLTSNKANIIFSTEDKEYIVQDIQSNKKLTEEVYLLEKNEYEKIKNNLQEYEIKEFNNYILAIRNTK